MSDWTYFDLIFRSFLLRECNDKILAELLLLILGDGSKGGNMAEESLDVRSCHRAATWLAIGDLQLVAQVLTFLETLVERVVA